MGWHETEDWFVNPYNFVPLEGKCVRDPIDNYTEGKNLLTGYIDCTLTALTPIIIPNTSNNKALHRENEKVGNSYNFYSYYNLEGGGESAQRKREPVLPGSEIRGTVRSVFEAAFNGCLSSVKQERKLYRRLNGKKVVYRTSIGDLLQANGGYQPCDDRQGVCPACALFGMVGNSSLASRVRFTDASVTQRKSNAAEYYQDKDYVLPELGEPKPGTVEFYTLPPKHAKGEGQYQIWTYDYVKTKQGNKPLHPSELSLRGRKFYWHSENWKAQKDGKIKKMRQRVRAVRKDCQFSFKVYFDRITEVELAKLQWALTFNDPDCAHKFGRGKPIGFGSGRIKIQHIYYRKLDGQTGERVIEKVEAGRLETLVPPPSNSQKRLRQIANWKQKPGKISYPKAEGNNPKSKNNEAAHQWFTANKNNDRFLKVLPKIEEELDSNCQSKWLYKMKEK